MSGRRRALGLSLADGALYSFMGGIADGYVVADALRLGAAGPTVVAITVLPALCAAIGAHRAEQRFAGVSRRRLVVRGVAIQAVELAMLSGLTLRRFTTPGILLAFACSQALLASFIATSWLGWFGELVPSRLASHYFARRGVWCQLAGFLGVVSGGALLQLSAHAGTPRIGFGLSYGLGAISLCGAAYCLHRSWDGPGRGRTACRDVARVLETSARAEPRTLPISWSMPVMQLALALGTPFVTPLLLQKLHFGYGALMLSLAALTASKSLALPAWARIIRRWGARKALSLSLLVAIPAGAAWLYSATLLGVVTTQAVGGLALGGYELSVTAALLGSSPSIERSALLAKMAVRGGLFTFVGGVLGYALMLRDPGAFALAFAAGACARLVAWLLSLTELPRRAAVSSLRS